jgi:endonuclease/exonuclease/phosphatase family metal-dependent hydrolase
MPVFPKPAFPFTFDVQQEIANLRAWKAHRQIPNKDPGRVLVATWNIANFGAQQREDEHNRLIAEILSWFDIAAIQEVRENFAHLDDVVRHMGAPYKMLFSDAAGNNERMAFVYDAQKLRLLEEVGEIAFPVSQLKQIALTGVTQSFAGFDRTPYFATFQAGQTSFLFVNVHLFYGSDAQADIERRSLETFGVAKWAELRRKSKFSFTRELFAMGDFNMPKNATGDPVFNALTKLGLELPAHSSEIGSSIASDNHFDQIAYFPGDSKNLTDGSTGIFDYDSAIFPVLWANGTNKKNFNAYLRYYISDHRLMWIRLKPQQ